MTHPTEKKKLSRKDAFIKWAMETPGVWPYSDLTLRRDMEDIDTFIGVAWAAWKASWRAKR